MDVGTIFPYINYMPGSGDFGEGSLYAFNTSTDKGQFVLSPSFQIASHTGAYPVSDPILKRFTVQVAPLDYAAAGASPDALLTTDVQSTKVLMDFNTEDLYTKQRNSTDWDGSWPQFNRNYANITYGGDDANTIRPIKGAPVRFRKIPLCTTQGTGYFYALASAPYIMTGAIGGGEALSQETGYLSDWDPSKTQLSIDCSEAEAAQVTGTGCFIRTFKQDSITYVSGIPNFYDSVNDSNIIQGFTNNSCGSGINFYNITGQDCIETRIEAYDSESLDTITINFTGQVVTTGNLDTSNLFATPGMSTDSNGCSSNSKILRLKNLIGTTGIGVINHDDDNLNVGMDCPFGGSDGWDADPGDSNTPGNNNPLHDCGFRLQCVELCDGAGNTYAAMIPLRYLAADGTWSATPVIGSTCP